MEVEEVGTELRQTTEMMTGQQIQSFFPFSFVYMVVWPTPHLSITTGMFPLVYRIQHTIQQDSLRPLSNGCPFWADVDTRGAASGLVYYTITPTHMIVQWENVGIFSSHTDKLNSFQLIITIKCRSYFVFRNQCKFLLQNMEWTTGDASGGVNGFGGAPWVSVGIK